MASTGHQLILSLLLLQLTFYTVEAQFNPLLHRDPMVGLQTYAENVKRSIEYGKDEDALPTVKYMKNLMTNFHLDANSNVGNTSECLESLMTLGKDLRKSKRYSTQMLDSWGKPASGIILGNTYWMGMYYECINARGSEFGGRYCALMIGAQPNPVTKTPFPVLSIGSCIPDTCSQGDLNQFFTTFMKKQKVYASCPVQPTQYTSVDIVALCIIAILTALIVVGTVCEVNETWFKNRQYERILFDNDNGPSVQDQPSVFSQILLSFSVIKNTRLIFDTSQKEGNINVLHGLRFFSMSWVILGHCFAFAIAGVDNAVGLAKYLVDHASFQGISNATFSVDTFFFLSGLLATYIGMKELEKRNGKINILSAYIYRYLRLTPAYALAILISSSLYSKFGDGPAWPQTVATMREVCSKYWWTNMLYINNIYPEDLMQECFALGWYLANDMQFFLFSPFILLLLHKFPKAGIATLSIGIVANIFITFGLSWHYKQVPQTVGLAVLCKGFLSNIYGGELLSSTIEYGGNGTTAAPTPSEADIIFSDLYAKPWCRFGVYFVGMLAGYLLHAKKLRIQMKKMFVIAGWVVAFVTGLTIIYGLWSYIEGPTLTKSMSVGLGAFYNGFSRPVWGLCLTWIVVACSTDHTGPINAFLSFKLFIPLSRLTYCAFLVHPLVIYWYVSTQETRLHFSINFVITFFAGILLLSYAVAYLFSLLIEMPTIGLIRMFVKKNKPSPSFTPPQTNTNPPNYTVNAPMKSDA